MDASADLELLREAAAEAGEIARGFWRHDPASWFKDGNSPVSEADLAVDAHLRRRLLDARPHYGWVSEETVSRPPGEGDDRGHRDAAREPLGAQHRAQAVPSRRSDGGGGKPAVAVRVERVLPVQVRAGQGSGQHAAI